MAPFAPEPLGVPLELVAVRTLVDEVTTLYVSS
jgi:hypothetical protein